MGAQGVYKYKNGDPLFIFGAVAVGMLGQPSLGASLAAAHYLSALLVGFTFRFYGGRENRLPAAPAVARPPSAVATTVGERGTVLDFSRPPGVGLWVHAFRVLYKARRRDGRPLGQVLNEAIGESFATLFKIFSFILLFSVATAVVHATRLEPLVEAPFAALLVLLGLDPVLAHGLFQGVLEIDIGAAAAAGADAPLAQKAVVLSAIIAWSGLSVHGQVATILAGQDIRMGPYVVARFLHAVYASALTPLFVPLADALPALAGGWLPAPGGSAFAASPGPFWTTAPILLIQAAARWATTMGLLLASALGLQLVFLISRFAVRRARPGGPGR